jgi:hypothetical protein
LGSLGRPFPRTIAEDLRYLQSVGASGTASQSDARLFRSLGPNYYTYAKLSWNVEGDVDAVLEDYYRHAYGPGGAAAQRVFDLWEEVYNSGGDYFRYDWDVIVPLFAPAVRARLSQSAQEVKRLAEDGTPEQRRRAVELGLVVELLDAFMRYARGEDPRAEERALRLAREHPFLVCSTKALDRAARAHREGL